jgi:hypothetical protein
VEVRQPEVPPPPENGTENAIENGQTKNNQQQLDGFDFRRLTKAAPVY